MSLPGRRRISHARARATGHRPPQPAGGLSSLHWSSQVVVPSGRALPGAHGVSGRAAPPRAPLHRCATGRATTAPVPHSRTPREGENHRGKRRLPPFRPSGLRAPSGASTAGTIKIPVFLGGSQGARMKPASASGAALASGSAAQRGQYARSPPKISQMVKAEPHLDKHAAAAGSLDPPPTLGGSLRASQTSARRGASMSDKDVGPSAASSKGDRSAPLTYNGTGSLSRSSAHWVSPSQILWRFPVGQGASKFYLHVSPTATLTPTKNGLVSSETRKPSSKRLGASGARSGAAPLPCVVELEPKGLAQGEVVHKFPWLEGCVLFEVPQAPVLTGAMDRVVRAQLAVSVITEDGELGYFTGVQIQGLLDELFYYDGALGAHVDRAAGQVSVSLWAPTAQSVELLLYDSADLAAQEPTVVPMTSARFGAWHARGGVDWDRKFYQYRIRAYHPATQAVEEMIASDPYARSTNCDGLATQVVDVADHDLFPEGWGTARLPPVGHPVDIVLYELHVRDFSATDPTVPDSLRGKYGAFKLHESNGGRHLSEMRAAGITHVHLLPSYDFATVPEREADRKDPDLEEMAKFEAASQMPQAILAEVKDRDSYNWGYDPVHFSTPEGSYASDPDGPARIREFRAMVEALHAKGLRVVLDVVYNHTYESGPTSQYSVLDKVVPGYYHRRDEDGHVLASTCCNNVACENRMVARLIEDDLMHWARNYKVDGFRFDIMGHLMKKTVHGVAQRLRDLTEARDGVDGRNLYLYGEGWDFGEMVHNRRGVNACMGNLVGTGVGSFNDRLRDQALGGGPFSDPREQGLATGLLFFDNPHTQKHTTRSDREAALLRMMDGMKFCLAGSLLPFEVTSSATGEVLRGQEFRCAGASALSCFTACPQETVNYISCHDNRTLFDLILFKAPLDLGLDVKLRMMALCQAMTILAQGVPFLHAGDELLRSKSLDRDSYNSGDWFNRIDWTGSTNHFPMGLPPSEKNRGEWALMGPILAREGIAPTADQIQTFKNLVQEFLRIRKSSRLFRLRTAEEICAAVRFHELGAPPADEEESAPGAEVVPGVIAMEISSDALNIPDAPAPPMTRADSSNSLGTDSDAPERVPAARPPANWGPFRRVLVVFNVRDKAFVAPYPSHIIGMRLHPIQETTADPVLRAAAPQACNNASRRMNVPSQTCAVFVEHW
ncbi:unnamed protein product [Pedinophyceae sp. YPF-701]|nr:unnamed protein product [Pedinophyceae sp. YPF-701]